MKMKLLAVLLALLVADAACADESEMKAALEKKFPYQKVVEIRKTPYPGWYEVDFDDRLLYVDKNLNYLFMGNVIDLRTMKNLTEEREKKLYSVKFDSLPLNLAIKLVRGTGKRRMVVFSDPNCGYCKKLEKEISKLSDASVYILPISILPGSEQKNRNIWCSPDRPKAWEEQMLNGVTPDSANACDTGGLERISQLAKTMGISITPTLLFEDGSTNVGLLSSEIIEQRLAR